MARLIITVWAAVLPGTPEDEWTKRFVLTSADWESATETTVLLATLNRQALDYAADLMNRPDRFNQVQVEWLWL